MRLQFCSVLTLRTGRDDGTVERVGTSPTLVGGGRRRDRRGRKLDHGRRTAGLECRVVVAVAGSPSTLAGVVQQFPVHGPPALRYEPQPGETLAEVLGQHAVQDRVDDRVEQREQQAHDEVVRPQEVARVLRVPAAVHVDQAHHNSNRQPHHQHHDHVDQQYTHHAHVFPVPELLVPHQHLSIKQRHVIGLDIINHNKYTKYIFTQIK